MDREMHQKVTTQHLQRQAYVYIRQSTLHQVFENTESTHRQYGMRERAVALGWPAEHIVVIDEDLGLSGASTAGREGFQKLVADVSLGLVGIVMGLEVSRLARKSSDWYRLLEICSLTDTLILDDDGLYDPNNFNDRMLLGLKGTMSEAELHFLKMRMRGGILSKARRGELKTRLPVGFVYTPNNQVDFDPDQQVQDTLRLFFVTFRRTGASTATVKAFAQQGIPFPYRIRGGPHNGEIAWRPLTEHRALQVLRNPRYAGAFFFGRREYRRRPDGRYTAVTKLSREEWISLVTDSHPGYISWDEYEENLRRLRDNAIAHGHERCGPPREGPALLQGLALCGRCGQRMWVRYRTYNGKTVPEYICHGTGSEAGAGLCQWIPGRTIDEAIGQLLVESVTPLALDVVLAVDEELQQRHNEVEGLLQQGVQRARYEADLAQRRYLQVDPDNRLVANTLEVEWNNRLRDLEDAKRHYEEEMKRRAAVLTEKKRQQIRDLAADFPRLWHDPRTPDRERKRMARLLIEDVTLIKQETYIIHVRFRGGSVRTLQLPLLRNAIEVHRTPRHVIEEIDLLLNHHTDDEIAVLLNEKGFRSGTGKPFDWHMVYFIRRSYGLKDRYTRLREAGYLTKQEVAERLGIRPSTALVWRKQGILEGIPYDQRGSYLFRMPAGSLLSRRKHSFGKLDLHGR